MTSRQRWTLVATIIGSGAVFLDGTIVHVALKQIVDILPYTIMFGIGLACVVAPLTSTLMGSVPGRYAGLGSAINNSVSRVGQPLLGALTFIAISATYYATLGGLAPSLDTGSGAVRSAFQPLNPPPTVATAAEVAAANQASMGAFHLAMVVCAALLVMGALVSWFGLRERGLAGAALTDGRLTTGRGSAPAGRAPAGRPPAP